MDLVCLYMNLRSAHRDGTFKTCMSLHLAFGMGFFGFIGGELAA